MANQPLLSIIVTSYTTERLRDIFELLDSIKAQTYPNIETILVIEKSSEMFDRVKKYVRMNNILGVNVIFNRYEAGASFARNLGIKEAKGDVVAFVDDDVVLFPNWAEEIVKTYVQDNSIIGVTGPIFPLWEDGSMAWFPEEFDWVFGCNRWLGLTNKMEVRSVNGANASFRRKSFDLAGNYCTALGPWRGRASFGEETELSLRVKRKTGKCIIYNTQVRVYHKVSKEKFKWAFMIQRSYQVGRTRHLLKKLYGTSNRRTDLLTAERELLRRISRRLLPQLLTSLFRNPLVVLRESLVIAICLFFVALGYYAPECGFIRPR